MTSKYCQSIIQALFSLIYYLYRSPKDWNWGSMTDRKLTVGKNYYYNKTIVISLESFDKKDWYGNTGKRPG